MLIREVHAIPYTYGILFPHKRGLQPIGPSSLTLLGWFRLTPIDQYSSLLPPVGVWTVSQFQCGGPSSQNPYRSSARWAVAPPTSYWHASLSVTTGVFNISPCSDMCYGVLVGVSTGYPPVTGKLLTRYAPFRRSPPLYCYNALPLDLHVLSLPLAFILSQDQTLLCIYTVSLVRPRQLHSLLNKKEINALHFSFSVLVVLIFQYCQ